MGSCLGIACINGGYLGVVERCGKYNGDLSPGCHCLIPFIDIVEYKFDMRQQIVQCVIDTKTKDNIFCVTKVSVYYTRNVRDGQKFAYGMKDINSGISSTVQNIVRPVLMSLNYDEALEEKENMADEILSRLNNDLSNVSGIHFDNVNIVDIEPDPKVRSAMNEIEVQNRLRMAEVHKAQALKVSKIAEAEANAEASRLIGKGIADQRREVMNGYIESLEDMKKNTGISSEAVMKIILQTQELDTLKHIGTSENTKCIFVPYNTTIGSPILEPVEQMSYNSLA